MRSFRWTPIAGWCVATATSIVLASVAILPVLRTTQPRDSALAQLPAAATSFPAPLPSATPGTSQAVPAPTGRRPRSTAPTGTATSKLTTTEDGWTVTTGADGLRTYVRSFKVDGGQAVVKVTSDGVVALVTATPADGWQVQKVQDSPDNLAVYFNETGHSFIIHVTWWDDRPFAEVSEIGQ